MKLMTFTVPASSKYVPLPSVQRLSVENRLPDRQLVDAAQQRRAAKVSWLCRLNIASVKCQSAKLLSTERRGTSKRSFVDNEPKMAFLS
jgi:hypothetical protein